MRFQCYLSYWVTSLMSSIESILGFLSTLSLGKPPAMIFDYARFIADSIHHQLTKFPTEGVFRYSYYLFNFLLFSQVDQFPIAL